MVISLQDKVQSHSKLTSLSAINIEYLPPNITAKLKTIAQVIMQNLKTHYHKRVLKQILFSIDFKKSYAIIQSHQQFICSVGRHAI